MLEGGNTETNNNTQDAESIAKKQESNAGGNASTPPNINKKKLAKVKLNSSINVELVDSEEIKQL